MFLLLYHEFSMKVLYLLRHAKSSWADGGRADVDRPLNERGREAVRRLARHLDALEVRPTIVLCSTARRTRETLVGIQDALQPGVIVRMREDLYLASEAKILSLVRGLDDAAERAMIIGHNPGIEGVARALAGDGEAKAWRRLFAKFPTGALAVVTSPVGRWRDFGPGSTRLDAFFRPKDLDE